MPKRIQSLFEDGALASDYFLEDGFEPDEQQKKQIENQVSLGSTLTDLGKELFNRPGALIKDIGKEALEEFTPSSEFLSSITPSRESIEKFKHYSGIAGAQDVMEKLKFANLFPGAQAEAERIGETLSPKHGDMGGAAGEQTLDNPALDLPSGMEMPFNPFSEMKPSEVAAGARGFGAGLVETPLKVLSPLDLAPLGKAAKYPAALADIMLADKATSGIGALKGLGAGLEAGEMAYGGLNAMGGAGGAITGAQEIGEGKTGQGAFDLASGVAGMALGGRSLGHDWTSPLAKEQATNTLGEIFPSEGSHILSKGRYMRPGEVEPVDPVLRDSGDIDPFKKSQENLVGSESIKDLFDVLRRGEDTVRREQEIRAPGETGTLSKITFDPNIEGGNLEGDVTLNLKAIADRTSTPEEFLSEALGTLRHESGGHERGANPHGYALVDRAADRVMRDETPNDSDVELGQTQFPEAFSENIKDVAYSKTKPYEDIGGNYVPEPTEADFKFRTRDEALEFGTREKFDEMIKEYMDDPNDRATLTNAYEMLKGERKPGADYREDLPEGIEPSLGKIEDKPKPKPIERYHGTSYEFDKLDPEKGIGNLGIHMGTLPQAESFLRPDAFDSDSSGAYENAGNIRKGLISVENPLRLPDMGGWHPGDILGEMARNGVISNSELDSLMRQVRELGYNVENYQSKREANQLVQNVIKSKGYDSIVYKNAVEDSGKDSHIIFDPKEQTISPYSRENLAQVRRASYKGQDVEILARKGNSVLVKLPDGTKKSVGFSDLSKPSVAPKVEPPKSKYDDVIKELEDLDKSSLEEKDLPPEEFTLDPKDVSLVADPLEDFPEVTRQKKIDDAFKRQVKDVQGQDKEAIRLQKEIEKAQRQEQAEIDGEEDSGPDPDEWMKTAAREVPKIERAQNSEILKDQPFRDQIMLQDKILRGQEQEALKAGKAEDAQKVALERKILRAQNEEVFKKHKEEQRAKLEEEKRKGALTKKIVKAQEAEEFAAHKKANPEPIKKEKSNFALDLLGLPRSLMTSMDLSAPGRQALPLITRKESFGAFKESLKSFASKEAHDRVAKELADSPHRQLMEDSGLNFTEIGSVSEMGGREEAFPSKFAEKIPLVAGSERAYSTYLNKLRGDVFSNITDKLHKAGEHDPKVFKALAEYINNATGRASLGKAEKFAPALNAVFFSPRLQASRLKLMAGLADPTVPKAIRKEMYRDLVGTTVGVGITLATMAKLGGAKVNTDDPRKSDFLRPTWGGTSVDLGGSFLPWITLGARLSSGTTIEKGEAKDLNTPGFAQTGKKAKSTTAGLLTRFARGKLAPVPSILLDTLEGKNYMGEQTGFLKSVGEHALPLGLKDDYELWNTKDVPPEMKPLLMSLGLLGAGVNTRKPPKKKAIKY